MRRENLELEDIIDIQELQSLMDEFHKITKLPMSIIDIKGRLLVGVGWQDICTKFHKIHPETRRNCQESDNYLTKGISAGTFKTYKCKNNMRDTSTPIIIEGEHLGNIFAGQFFFEDETVDYELFRAQAKKYGFDEGEYMAALERVPRWPRKTIYQAMAFYAKLAHFISQQGHKNIRLSQTLRERQKAQIDLADAHQRVLTILDSMDALVYVADMETCEILYINQYGRSEHGNVHGMKCWQVLHEGQTGPCDFCTNDKLLNASSQPTGVYYWEHNKTKTQKWYACRDIALQWTDGRMVRLEIATDITQRKKAEEALQSQLKFEKMVSEISSYIVSLPPQQLDQGITHALKLTLEFFQIDRTYIYQYSADGEKMSITHEWCSEGIESQLDEAQNFTVDASPWWAERIRREDHINISEVDSMPPEAELEKRAFKSQDISSLLCIPMIKNGALFAFLGFDAVREKREWTEGQITLLKIVAEVIANALIRRQTDEKIRYLSFHDQLTGLYNRFLLEEEIKRLDNKRQLPISIIMADLNELKLINDTYGHEAGDEMLKSVAEVLKNSCREEDIVARWGGDEFIILLPQTTIEDAGAICRRINRRCIKAYVENIPISVALGASSKDNIDKDLTVVLKEAEDRMYRHKLIERSSEKSAVLNAFLKTLETKKGFETETHIRTMYNMAFKVGRKIGLSDFQLKGLETLIKLHDIGKITIPEDILTKKGALTPEEWEIMKEHPETGYRIAHSKQRFAHVAEDILAHHERWDGSGYPRGLKGEEIPLLARITAIADAYEVMTRGRPYKKALSPEEVVAELKRCAGSQFDPELVEVFLSILED